MKKLADQRFGHVFQPSSFSELIDLIVGSEAKDAHIFMWRGQSDEKWLLHSSAYRRVAVSDQVVTERAVRFYEEYLIEKAEHKGFRVQDGREMSDFELLARLQHHGAATRFLDTTRNALVALFFACMENREKDGMLFGIHCHHLGGGEGRLLKGSYRERMESIKDHVHPQTWEPPNVSRRVAAQHSQFIYSAINISGHGSIAIENVEKYMISIVVKSSLKEKFLEILRNSFDINVSTLFPDIDGFGRAHGPFDRWSSVERW